MNWNTALYHPERIRAKRYTVSAEVRIRGEGRSQADLVFFPHGDLRGDRFWKVSLQRSPDFVGFQVMKAGQWKTVVEQDVLDRCFPLKDWVRACGTRSTMTTSRPTSSSGASDASTAG